MPRLVAVLLQSDIDDSVTDGPAIALPRQPDLLLLLASLPLYTPPPHTGSVKRCVFVTSLAKRIAVQTRDAKRNVSNHRPLQDSRCPDITSDNPPAGGVKSRCVPKAINYGYLVFVVSRQPREDVKAKQMQTVFFLIACHDWLGIARQVKCRYCVCIVWTLGFCLMPLRVPEPGFVYVRDVLLML